MRTELEKLFMSQHGLVLTNQAVDNGESYETIARRVDSNEWYRPMPRVVRPVGVPLDLHARLSAAKLSIGGDVTFAGATAAAIWAVPGSSPPERLHVVVGAKRNVRSTEFVRIQRQDNLLVSTFTRGGWPVVALEAAVVGMAPEVTFVDLADAVQELLRRRRTTTARLLSWTGRGVLGSPVVRAAVAVAGDGYQSKWERRLAGHLALPDRPRPKPQFRVVAPDSLVAYVDLAFPDVLLAVEIDGYVAHSRPAASRYDRVRQNALVAKLEWTVLRYTPYEIATAPGRLVAEIWACYDRLVAAKS